MTLACTVNASGITAPSYPEILAQLKVSYTGIYGDDVYLEPDSQDGQWLAVMALAIHDANTATIATYNSYSPATAQGEGLSSVVKTNGITRAVSTYSTVDLRIVGQAGTIILGGIAGPDGDTEKWNLPPQVIIPYTGEVTVTATCQDVGAIGALPNTITRICTPTLGWQTVNNLSSATQGIPVESDAALRMRQRVSTALPSIADLDGIVGAVMGLEGVTLVLPYENDTRVVDANGQDPNSIALVVQGGDAQAICNTIYTKKTPGAKTVGTTTLSVLTAYGAYKPISFYRPTDVHITVSITIKPLPGFSSSIGLKVVESVIDCIASHGKGTDVSYGKVSSAANLNNGPNSSTFEVKTLQMGRDGQPVQVGDVPIAFNELAFTDVSSVVLVSA